MPTAPSTPQLSTFEPPAENPISEDGNWAQSFPVLDPLKKNATHHVTDTVHGASNYSHWTKRTFDTGENGRVEAYGCTSGGQLGAAVEAWRVSLWTSAGIGSGSQQGYQILFGGGIGEGYFLRRYDSYGDYTVLDQVGAGFPHMIAVVIDGGTVEGWGNNSGVWTRRVWADDTSYRGKFFAGLGIEDPTGGGLSFTCFGGGVPQMPQFFRWTRGFKEPGPED